MFLTFKKSFPNKKLEPKEKDSAIVVPNVIKDNRVLNKQGSHPSPVKESRIKRITTMSVTE